MVQLHLTGRRPQLQIRSLLNGISWTTGLISKSFHRIIPHYAFYQNCINGSTPPNKGAARALDKTRILMTFPPEPLVQIPYNFTWILPMMPSFNIAQIVLLLIPNRRTARATDKKSFKWHLMNHWPKFKLFSQYCFSWCTLPKFHKWFLSTDQ